MSMNLIGVIVFFIVVAFAVLVWHLKKREAVSRASNKSQTVSEQVRSQLGVRNIATQVLGLFAGLLFIGGAMSLLGIDESIKTDRRTAIIMIVLSQLLILCIAWLGKKPRDTI
jgi:hypothetical protein